MAINTKYNHTSHLTSVNLGSPEQLTKPCFMDFRKKESLLLWGIEAEIAFGETMVGSWWLRKECWSVPVPGTRWGKKTSPGTSPGRSELKTKQKDMVQPETDEDKGRQLLAEGCLEASGKGSFGKYWALGGVTQHAYKVMADKVWKSINKGFKCTPR